MVWGDTTVMQICPKCRAAQDVQGPPGAPAVCKKCGTKFVALASNAPAGADQARTMVTPMPPPASGAGQDKTMITPVPPSGAPKPSAASRPPAPAAAGQDKTMITPAPPSGASKPAPASRPPAAAKPAAGAEEDPLVGKTLGGYRILRKLGQGGMGAVYEAHQISLDRSVALKVLPAALAAQKDFLQRFLREAHAVAQLNHNNIIQIAAERGLPALACWLWLLAQIVVDHWRRFRQLRAGPDPGATLWPVLAIAVTVALFVGGLFEYNFGDSEVLLMYCALISLAYVPVLRPGTDHEHAAA